MARAVFLKRLHMPMSFRYSGLFYSEDTFAIGVQSCFTPLTMVSRAVLLQWQWSLELFLIVSIPDLCTITYFYSNDNGLQSCFTSKTAHFVLVSRAVLPQRQHILYWFPELFYSKKNTLSFDVQSCCTSKSIPLPLVSRAVLPQRHDL